jgi:hypothetical protein
MYQKKYAPPATKIVARTSPRKMLIVSSQKGNGFGLVWQLAAK